MASKKRATENATPPSIPPERGVELLNEQIAKAGDLLGRSPLPKDDYAAWETLTQNILVKAFGSASPNVKRVMDIGKYGSFPMDASPQWWHEHRRRSLTSQISQLRSMTEVLGLDLGHSLAQTRSTPPLGKDVFLVHGRDESAREGVARFLERLVSNVIILHEQPNGGRTIIEKFEAYSDVAFAVVLLTPDDVGGLKGTDAQEPRARQNVILELGFFLGRLGRARVCALYVDGVQIPSDYDGVLFVALDAAGAWKMLLGREMKAAGLDIDMNAAV
ncbi:MAG: nucleotide-binding protein [Planctomycetes bacterium]|nr:nucleotide-binding protein [Planctomycetota bacterium]